MMEVTESLNTRTVDQNDLRVNATLVITVLVTAFVVNRWELVAFQAVALFLTTVNMGLGPYVALYRHILRPLGIVEARLRLCLLDPYQDVGSYFESQPLPQFSGEYRSLIVPPFMFAAGMKGNRNEAAWR